MKVDCNSPKTFNLGFIAHFPRLFFLLLYVFGLMKTRLNIWDLFPKKRHHHLRPFFFFIFLGGAGSLDKVEEIMNSLK